MRHTLAASYITGQDNPWFARAFVNRVWYVLLGESFYDAVDDLGPGRTPKAPVVIETLADQWQKGGYDVRWLFRTIAQTKAYQRRVRSTANPAGKTAFASNCPSRLRSDQIALGLAEALGLSDDLRPVPASARSGSQKWRRRESACNRLRPGRRTASRRPRPRAWPPFRWRQRARPRPVRAGGPRVFFNALFGVDPSVPSDEVLGTIPQALFLMNGPLIQNRTQARPGTVLGEILASSASPRAALDALYLRVLSRIPSPRRSRPARAYLAASGNQAAAFEDIYWALINSTEFISRR